MSYYIGKRDQQKTTKSNVIRAWAKKLKAIELLGGGCEICKESRPWLLDFHHKDEKLSEINYLRTRSWALIENEIKKCKLLCRNCHGDIHYKSKFLEYEEEIRTKTRTITSSKKGRIDRAKVIKLQKQGKSQAQIANVLDCSCSMVCEILKLSGIHTYKKKKILNVQEILRLREQGLTNPQIAEKLNCHRFSIPHAIKRWKEKNDSISSGQ